MLRESVGKKSCQMDEIIHLNRSPQGRGYVISEKRLRIPIEGNRVYVNEQNVLSDSMVCELSGCQSCFPSSLKLARLCTP